MATATISGRLDPEIKALLARQVGPEVTECQVVSRDVRERVLERAYPGIAFRDSAAGREAYLQGHRVAVWEVVEIHKCYRAVKKTAEHLSWPVHLVKLALDYAAKFPEEIEACRKAETE
jgi:hypothetical protein